MSDPLLLAVGPAAITGLVGYAGARLQARTADAGIRAELDRLHIQRQDEVRGQRQETYHDFLALLHRLDTAASDLIGPPLSQDSFSQWMAEFDSQYVCVSLFGTDAAREKAKAVWEVVGDIGADAQNETQQTDDFIDEFIKSYKEHRPALDRATGSLTEVMRNDLALYSSSS